MPKPTLVRTTNTPRVDPFSDLSQKITSKSAKIGILGLGYVGLPLAIEKAKKGFQVIGIDTDSIRVTNITNKQNYISDVKQEELDLVIDAKRFSATTDPSVIKDLDVLIITVPTPLTQHLVPDLSFVESASHSIAKYLRPGQLISLESTTYPGTTKEVVLPILNQTGLTLETDFFLIYSPERVDPGNRLFKTDNTNKLVAGMGPRSLELGLSFYRHTIPNLVSVSDPAIAEMAKIFENTFRSVNIALVNEMTLLCDKMGINIWEVLDSAFTKPFGIMPFYPGPGVGGHCIPLDPHYLEWKAKEHNYTMRFIALAGDINRRMPEYVTNKLARILNVKGKSLSQSKIFVLGVAYKKNVADYRESPALEVIRHLQKQGASVSYHDPHVPKIDHHGILLENQVLNDFQLSAYDSVLILTAHSGIDYERITQKAQHVFDTRNACLHIKDRQKITLL